MTLLLWAGLIIADVIDTGIDTVSLGCGGAALIVLSDPIARFSVGPIAMDVGRLRLKSYWILTTCVGIALIAIAGLRASLI